MSKKKYDKFCILRDSREKEGKGWIFRASSNCTGMITRKLETGDYSLLHYEDTIMIERKTLSDLWVTLTRGRDRFMREMERAKKYPVRYLVIEGTLADVNKGIPYSKVRGDFILACLTSLQIKYGIHVIFTHKRTDIAQTYIRKLLAKLWQYCEDGVIKKYGRPDYSK